MSSALNKEGARFSETDEACIKLDSELTLTEALNRFREKFDKYSRTEKIFNPQHLLRALETYDALFNNFRNWDQRVLFCRQVMGFVLRFMPACYAQALAQGIYYITEESEELRRSFAFRYGGGSFYPLEVSCKGLGFDYCALRSGARWSWVVADEAVVRRALFETFVEQKRQAWRTYATGSSLSPRDAVLENNAGARALIAHHNMTR